MIEEFRDHYLCTEPWWTVPELLFEKKGLIPALQQLLFSRLRPKAMHKAR
jgi:hypothetical protein